jgi:membrane associated rhomboid family serine protease
MIPLRDKNPTGTVPYAIAVIIILNVLVWLYELSLGTNVQYFLLHYGLVPRNFVSMFERPYGVFTSALGPLFSSMFMHLSWFHIIFNMWFLWIFGDNVEDLLGHKRFLVFYVVCGIGSGLAHVVVHTHSSLPMVGASGAVSGVLGAYALSFPKARILTYFAFWPFYVSAYVYFIIWFALQLLPGFLEFGGNRDGSGVAYWAHIGGFIIGMGLLLVLPKRPRFVDRSESET